MDFKETIINQIDVFRDKINEDNDFIILKYNIMNSKNLWNCICSAMDWMDVAKEHVADLSSNTKRWKELWKDIYSYLSAVDIIVESIEQLYRVVFKKNDILLNNDTSIFNDIRLFKDDNEYFKHIRAIFGAHSVNVEENNTRKFASWPTNDIYTEYDYAVLLYSSNKNDEDVVFGFKIEDVNKYLLKRVKFLENILIKINEQKNKFYAEMKEKEIEKKSNIIEYLNILKSENAKRFNNDYYDNIIDELIIIFNTNINDEINESKVREYKTMIEDCIDEIYTNLQNMSLLELIICKKLEIKISNEGMLRYAFSKLSDQVHSNIYKPLICEDEIRKYISKYFNSNYISINELYIFVLATSYFDDHS